MTSQYVRLDFWQVGIAALLMVVSGAISLALGLGLERRLLLGLDSHGRATAADRPGAEVDLHPRPLVLLAGDGRRHDAHCRRLGRPPHRTELPGDVARQRVVDGAEFLGDGGLAVTAIIRVPGISRNTPFRCWA